MDISAALPTFVITLREGVEAALVVGIVLACLEKANQQRFNPWVYGGIGAGLGASLGVGLLLNRGFDWVHRLDPSREALVGPSLKVLLCGLAIAMLSWMLIWMTRQAKSLKGEIEGSVASLLTSLEADTTTSSYGAVFPGEVSATAAGVTEQTAGWGLFSLIFIAVLREGFETAVFILANVQQQGSWGIGGAVAGLMGATAMGLGLFKFGVRINLGQFFQVMGLMLLLIVAGLVTSLVKNFEAVAIALQAFGPQLCWSQDWNQASCIMGPLLWDSSAFLPDGTFPGLLFKVLLGYRDHVYGLQAAGYGLFLLTVGGAYFRSLQRAK